MAGTAPAPAPSMAIDSLQTPQLGAAVRGCAEIGFVNRGEGTRLQRLYQHDPLRILFPNPAVGELPTAAITNTGGGFVGGDHVKVTVSNGAHCRALVAQQAAEKIYRSAGQVTEIDVSLRAEAASWLEWLPQETILFDQAQMRRRTRIDVQGSGRVLAGEILVFGRAAMRERFRRGLLREVWEVRRDDRLIWLDALHLEGEMGPIIHAPAGFDGAGASATAVYVGDDAGAHLQTARRCLTARDQVRSAATLVNGVLVMRWLAPRAQDLRQDFGDFWAKFRSEVADLPGRLPRLWHI